MEILGARATASGFLAVLIYLILEEKVLSVRPFSAFDQGVGFTTPEPEDSTEDPPESRRPLTGNFDDPPQHGDATENKSKNIVTEVEATVYHPADGQIAGGHVSQVTVTEEFEAGDPPGVKLSYHRGLGSQIMRYECDKKGAWRRTPSMLDQIGHSNIYVKAIDGTDVRDVDPQVLTELWAARINGTRSYTVTFTTEPSYVTVVLYVALCTLPWCLASCIACCTLPCAIHGIYMKHALKEIDNVAEESTEEPVPRLQECCQSRLLEHEVTRWSLLGFGVGSMLLSARTYASVAVSAPTTSAIMVGEAVFFGALTFFVAAGVKATKKNALLASGSMCPKGLTEALSKQLQYVLLSLTPMLVCVYLALLAWLWLPYYCDRYGFFSLEDVARYNDVLWLGPYLLIFVCLPHFLINSHILAKVVEAHVRAVGQKVEEILQLESQQKGEGMKQLKPKLKEIHEACIGLRMDVLPSLECIVAPTLGFAACSWAFVLMKIVAFLSGHLDDLAGGNIGIFVIVSQFLFVILIFLPLGVNCLLPPASVSDAFDNLLELLNQLRTLDGMEDDTLVRLTESYIKESNRGQGLGFAFFGIVINTRLIKAVFLKIAASASLLLSAFYRVLATYTEARRLLYEVPH